MIKKIRAFLKNLSCPRNMQMFGKKNSSLPNIFGTKEKSGFSKSLGILEFLCRLIISSTFKKVEEIFHSSPNILGTLKKSS